MGHVAAWPCKHTPAQYVEMNQIPTWPWQNRMEYLIQYYPKDELRKMLNGRYISQDRPALSDVVDGEPLVTLAVHPPGEEDGHHLQCVGHVVWRHVLYLDRQHHRGEEHEDDLLVSDPGDDRGKAATCQPVALLVARLQRLQVVMELFVLILC